MIRQSRALDAVARRHWLAVLPHLTADDRARLREILADASPASTPTPTGDSASTDPEGTGDPTATRHGAAREREQPRA